MVISVVRLTGKLLLHDFILQNLCIVGFPQYIWVSNNTFCENCKIGSKDIWRKLFFNNQYVSSYQFSEEP